MNVKAARPLLAPYIAVLVFWLGFQSAWGAILAYHVQILFGARRHLPSLWRGWDSLGFWVAALPAAAAGPLAYLLLPRMTAGTELSAWLSDHGLAGVSLLVMIPYFGLVHPLLEQIHWSRLRPRGWIAHAAFAGYHALVLASLFTRFWLALSLLVLVLVSVLWARLQARQKGGLLIPALGHVFADLGLVLAAWLRAA
jgi:hypothetical protein